MSYSGKIIAEGGKHGWGFLLVTPEYFKEFIAGLLREYGRIKLLDVGAWKRMLAGWLRQHFGDRVEYYGVDVVDPGAEVRDAWFQVMAPTYLLFPPSSFHAVVFIESLEHIYDYTLALREAYRLLVPGGGVYIQSVICSDPCALNDETHVHVLHPVTLKRLMTHLGFRNIDYKIKGGTFALWGFK